jgi:hypothetical protein
MNMQVIENAIDFLHDLHGVSDWRYNSTPSNNRYMVELLNTITALEQFKAEQKQTIVTDLPAPPWDDSVTHNLELKEVSLSRDTPATPLTVSQVGE